MSQESSSSRESLFLVLGGELSSLERDPPHFLHPESLDLVGVYTDRKAARIAWKEKAQQTVDRALVRYFILDIGPCFRRE